MTDKFNLNGVDLELKPIKDLVNNNEKMLAIKQVIDLTGCSLIVGKNFVEQIDDLENFNPNKNSLLNGKEGVTISNRNGNIKVTYINGKLKKIVTPSDIEWKRVKVLLQGNQTLVQYEKQFSEGKIGKSQTLIQKNEGFFKDFSGIKTLLTAVIIFVAILIYLEFFR